MGCPISPLLLWTFSYLISGGFEFDFWAAPHDNERVKEMALDAGGGEGGVVRLQEHDAHDVIANVTLPLELKGEEEGNKSKN